MAGGPAASEEIDRGGIVADRVGVSNCSPCTFRGIHDLPSGFLNGDVTAIIHAGKGPGRCRFELEGLCHALFRRSGH